MNQTIRTIGTALIITAWLFAATKNQPKATEYACIGLGLFIAGSVWPVIEKINQRMLNGIGMIATGIWQAAVGLFQQHRASRKED